MAIYQKHVALCYWMRLTNTPLPTAQIPNPVSWVPPVSGVTAVTTRFGVFPVPKTPDLTNQLMNSILWVCVKRCVRAWNSFTTQFHKKGSQTVKIGDRWQHWDTKHAPLISTLIGMNCSWCREYKDIIISVY